MKKSIKLSFLLAIFFCYSCKIEGPPGPAGRDGLDGKDGSDGKDGKIGIKVYNFSIEPYEWDGSEIAWGISKNCPIIDESIAVSGIVLCYLKPSSSIGQYQQLPYSFLGVNTTFSYNTGTISFLINEDLFRTKRPTDTMLFKVIAIDAVTQLKYPEIKLMKYSNIVTLVEQINQH